MMVGRRFGPRTAEQPLPMLTSLFDEEDIALLADALIERETADDFLRRVREAC